jgi:alpha/beta superfamily hydrolase
LLNSDDVLLKEAFFVSEQLTNENKGSWTSCVKAIRRFLYLSPVKFKRKLIRHKVIKLLQEKYILKWQEELFRDISNSEIISQTSHFTHNQIATIGIQIL